MSIRMVLQSNSYPHKLGGAGIVMEERSKGRDIL